MNNTHAKLCEQSDKFAQELINSARQIHREGIHSKLDSIIRKNYQLGKSGKLTKITKNLEQIQVIESENLKSLKK